MAVLSLFFSILVIANQHIRFARAAPSTPLKVVNLGYATYQSDLNLEDGVISFLGVRYAAPPTGKSSSVTFLVVLFLGFTTGYPRVGFLHTAPEPVYTVTRNG